MFSFIYWVCAYAFETSILIKKVNIANPPPQFPHPFAVPSAMLPGDQHKLVRLLIKAITLTNC